MEQERPQGQGWTLLLVWGFFFSLAKLSLLHPRSTGEGSFPGQECAASYFNECIYLFLIFQDKIAAIWAAQCGFYKVTPDRLCKSSYGLTWATAAGSSRSSRSSTWSAASGMAAKIKHHHLFIVIKRVEENSKNENLPELTRRQLMDQNQTDLPTRSDWNSRFSLLGWRDITRIFATTAQLFIDWSIFSKSHKSSFPFSPVIPTLNEI